jgi:rSAM/selenodomain-associated transferase 1
MATKRPDHEGGPRAAVVVMAKVPIAGRTKTRLGEALSGEDAAGLYAAMLADRLVQVASLEDVVPAVAVAGHDGTGPVPEVVPPGFRVVPQPPGDLGVGLAAAAAHFLDEGLPVVLVDSDSPSLPIAYLREAVALVRGVDPRPCDLVLGACEDGGYYLLGLTAPHPELFADMPWSTSEVVPRTLERAGDLGLRVVELPGWWDVDTPADLDRLRATLFQTSWPARTAEWLRQYERRMLPPPREDRGGTYWRAPWTTEHSRLVYATPWLTMREDQARMPDGRPTTYSVVDCGECVGILPFTDPDTVLLVRQYRYVAGRVTWEMPTGGVHAGEDPDTAARRELAEEAQVHATTLEPLGAYHTSKSVMDETAHLYLAHGLSPARTVGGDETEFIRAEPVPFSQALDWVLSGEIVDGMTIIAVLRVALARAES